MNVIFLDIDGVVNTLMLNDEPFDTLQGQISRNGIYYNLNMPEDLKVSNKQAIMWLNKICIETNSKIVITSTWRMGYNGFENTIQALRNSGLFDSIEIIGATPILYSDVYHIRGNEIDKYLNDNPKIKNYVILDDDSDMCEYQMKHLVQTDTHVGITYNTYLECINILGHIDKIN